MPSKDLLLRITGDSSSAERALLRAEMAQRKYDLAIRGAHAEMDADFKRSADAQAAAVSKVGTVLLGVGTAAAAGLGMATREAMQWESAWAGVTKTVSGSTSEMDALEQGLRDMALTLPATHEEIAGVAAAAGALGIEGPNILKFTKTMIDLGQATDDLDAQTAATALAQFMNVVGTGQDDVDRLGASLVALGNNGASTEGQILEMAQRLAAAGKIANFTEGDILGMASALTSVGIDAEAGGSAFSRVFISIDDAVKTGNASLETFATVAGMSVQQFSTAFRDDAAGATTAFVEGLGRLDASGASLTGTLDELGLSDIRVRNALLSAAGAGDLMRESVELGNDAWTANNALQDEVAKRYETTEAKVKMARNALVDAGIDIGSQLLPVLAQMANTLSDVLGWFTDLPGPVKTIITSLGGLTAVGGLGVGAFLKLQSASKKFLDTMDATPGLLNATTKGMKALGAAGVIGGVVALAYSLRDLAGFMGDIDVDTSKLATAFYVLAQTGEDTAGATDILGVSLSDLRDDMNGLDPGEDLNVFAQQLAAVGNTLTAMVQAGDLDQAAKIIDTLGLSAEEGARLFPSYAAALEEVGARASEAAESTEGLTPAQKDLADQFGLTGQEAKDAADDLSAMDDALHAIYDTMFGGQEAQDAVAQGWIDLRDSITDMKDRYAEAMAVLSDPEASDEAKADAQELIDKYGTFTGILTGNTTEALANRDAMREQIQSYLDQIDTLDEVALGSEEYKRQVQALKDEFIKNATEAGYAEEGVLNYAKAFDEVPTNVPTSIEQPGMDVALRNTQYLSDKLAALQGTTTHTVNVVFNWDEGWFSAPPGGGGSSSGGAQGAGAPAGGGERSFGDQSYGDQSFGDQSYGSQSFSVPAGRGSGSDGGRGYDGPPMQVHQYFQPGQPESVGIDNAHRLAGMVGIL